ncbi:MAG: penicillin-binding protein activator [Holosporaceae bacterium]|nr:penicillin-binding protein activator [Holosporaceae bacterium]
MTKVHRSIRLFLLLYLASCSLDKNIHRQEEIPAQEFRFDELFDPRLKLLDQKENVVLLLLPLSGSNSYIGMNVLNACLMDLNEAQNIDFYVVDTTDTSRERYTIYNRLKNKNLKAIIGPVFSSETAQYGALFPNTPILSFSNNLKINSGHVFACGLSLQDEIRALVAYANAQQINSFLIMLPNGELGDQIVEIIGLEFKKYGMEEGDDLEIIRYTSITRKAATKYANNSNKKAVFIINPILTISKLEDIQVFTLSSAALSNIEVWDGVIFAFFDNQEQQEFVKKYRSVFGMQPTILDIMGYDLMKIVKESIISRSPIVQNYYQSCLGEFFLDKKSGLRRKLQIFRLENSRKIELTPSSENSELSTDF